MSEDTNIVPPKKIAPPKGDFVGCILPTCEWSMDVAAPEPDADTGWAAAALGKSLDSLVTAKARQHAAAVEREIEKHLRTHPVREWVAALAAAQEDLRIAHEERRG